MSNKNYSFYDTLDTTLVIVKMQDYLDLNKSVVPLESSSLKTIDNFYIYKSSMHEHTSMQSNETDSPINDNDYLENTLFSFIYISNSFFNSFSFIYVSNVFSNSPIYSYHENVSFNDFNISFLFQHFLYASSSMPALDGGSQFGIYPANRFIKLIKQIQVKI